MHSSPIRSSCAVLHKVSGRQIKADTRRTQWQWRRRRWRHAHLEACWPAAPGRLSPGQHTVSPRTVCESSGEVSGVLYGRRALADEPERRRAALPRPPDGDDRAADRGPRPISAVRVRSNGRKGPQGWTGFQIPSTPWTLFRSPSAPHLHAGAPRRPRRPGPPLPSRSPPAPVTAWRHQLESLRPWPRAQG